jgi:hypothetical protein
MASFSSLLKNLEFVIPNGVCEVRNLSFLGILTEEGFLASLGMTAKRIFQQPLGAALLIVIVSLSAHFPARWNSAPNKIVRLGLSKSSEM